MPHARGAKKGESKMAYMKRSRKAHAKMKAKGVKNERRKKIAMMRAGY